MMTVLFICYLATLVALAVSQGSGSFTSPGPQIEAGDYSTAVNFNYGVPQTFRWTVNVPAVRLALWQQVFVPGHDDGAEYILEMNNTQKYYNWDGRPTQDLSYGRVFFLQMYDASYAIGTASPIATSQYFNITGGPSSSSSSSMPSSSSSASPSPSTSSILSTTSQTATTSKVDIGGPSRSPTPPKNSQTATQAAQHHSDSNDALPIGLGVGLSCALILALGAAGFFYRKYKKRSRSAIPANAHQPIWSSYSGPISQQSPSELDYYGPPKDVHQLDDHSIRPKWSHPGDPHSTELP